MQSTKPPYTSIRSVPAGAILGNSSGATAAAQALDASTVRTVIGLGTAATAAAGDFEPAGSIAALSSVYQPLDSDLTAIAALTTTTFGRALLALADAAAGRTAFGLGTAATAAIAATGTADRVQKRSGTGNTLVDSLFGVTDTTGIASLTGTAAAYRAYGPTGVPYTSLSHDGTNGVLATSSGDLTLSPASGITALAASQKIKWGVAGTGMQLSLTVGSNPQLNVRDHTDSYYARIRADTYYWNNGEFLYSDNAKMKFRKAFDAAYLPIWAGTLRAYDANTNYTELSHDGTDGRLTPSAGRPCRRPRYRQYPEIATQRHHDAICDDQPRFCWCWNANQLMG